MRTYEHSVLRYLQVAWDAVVTCVAFLLATWTINSFLRVRFPILSEIELLYHGWTVLLLIPALVFFRRKFRMTVLANPSPLSRRFARVPLAVLLAVVFYAFALFIIRHPIPRPFVILLGLVLSVLLLATDLLLRRFLRFLFLRGYLVERNALPISE